MKPTLFVLFLCGLVCAHDCAAVGEKEKKSYPELDKKFEEWTKGLSPEEARVAVFNRIRDIPYAITPSINDPYEWAASLLANNRGSCGPKHFLLGYYFEKLGIPVQYVSYPFRWDDQPVRYPDELKKPAQSAPIVDHVSCKAMINGRWVVVDATWSRAMKRAGFPVNDHWDGVSGTLIAVKPLGEVVHQSPQERVDYVNKRRISWTQDDRTVYAEFVGLFNKWVKELQGN